MTISDMKAMYDRYYEQLGWYENQLYTKSFTQEVIDDYKIKITIWQLYQDNPYRIPTMDY